MNVSEEISSMEARFLLLAYAEGEDLIAGLTYDKMFGVAHMTIREGDFKGVQLTITVSNFHEQI